MEKQLLWNFQVNPQDENIRYFFAIIKEPRESRTLKNRLIETLAPVDEVVEREGSANKTHYHILAFTSARKLEQIPYKGKTKKDERLYERAMTGIDGLEAYVTSLLQKK